MSNTPIRCPDCKGSGNIRTTKTCSSWNGRGSFEPERIAVEGNFNGWTERRKCNKCSGVGRYVEDNWCRTCFRTGQVIAEVGDVTCPLCNGTLTIETKEQYLSGLNKRQRCPKCNGRGKIMGTVYHPDLR
ncbi:MAG: zinc finger domain-containing protein [Methylococcales bacterium]